MPQPSYSFGPYVLDLDRRRLVRDGAPLSLSDKYIEVLRLLVSKAGEVVTKDAIIACAWADVAVADNSAEQAMSIIRRTLGPAADGEPYIETLARRGYRFRQPVSTVVTRGGDDELRTAMQPFRMFLEGRAAIETLGREAVERARHVFADVVAVDHDYAPGHIGLANALALAFDAARVAGQADPAMLRKAVQHAREACLLDVESGEAWATLAFVLSRAGDSLDAVAAGRRATTLEPENWRHHVRLAYASWGEARLAAARSVKKRLPGLGLAHWLSATVFIARGAFGEAVRELDAGIAAEAQPRESGHFAVVGLHLLRGLVHLAQGEEAAAVAALQRELALEPAGHLYAPYACASAWCAIGVMHLRRDAVSAAAAAFEQTLERAPGHAMALAALAHVTEGRGRDAYRARLEARVEALERLGAGVDAAVARAGVEVLLGRHAEAASRVRAALDAAPPGSAGWTIPVEPVLSVSSHLDEWRTVLGRLANAAA